MPPASKVTRKATKRSDKTAAKVAEKEAARVAEKAAKAEEVASRAREAARAKEEARLLRDLQDAGDAYSQAARGLILQCSLQEANVTARPSSADLSLKALDSSVKRNAALIKKLRSVSEDSKQAILDDIDRVNQSKYVTEAVTAIAEAPLRARDIPAAVQVCSALHQQYKEFGTAVVKAVAAAAAPPPRATSAAVEAADAAGTIPRRRIVLRLLAALLTVGVGGGGISTAGRDSVKGSGGRALASDAQGWQLLTDALKQLSFVDFKKDRQQAVAAVSVAGAFAKAERTGLLAFPVKDPVSAAAAEADAEGDSETKDVKEARAALIVARSLWQEAAQQRLQPPAPVQQAVFESLLALLEAAKAALEQEHLALSSREANNTRLLTARGDLPEHVAEAFAGQQQRVEALHRAAAALAEPLDQPMPPLPESHLGGSGTGGSVSVIVPKDKDDLSGGLFEDEDTRAFYEDFPDLHALLPAFSFEAAIAAAADEGSGCDAPPDLATLDGASDGATSVSGSDGDKDDPAGEREADAGVAGAARAAEVRAIIDTLPTCVSRETCDAAAMSFCIVQTKSARKHMARALSDMPRGGLQLVPFYMRIAATLARLFPDIGHGVVNHTELEFKRLQRRRDAIGREGDARLRNVRALGELAKFRIVPFGSVLSRLKLLLDDFSGHNVEAVAALLDTAGRFLYRLPETRDRMATMAEVMMKLKSSKNLDARLNMLLDHAYFQVRPPERAKLTRKLKEPLHAFICHLLRDVLAPNTVLNVLRKLRKLPWPDIEPYLTRKIIGATRGTYGAAPLLASLTAALSRYHPSLGIRVCDMLLEDIRQGLESPDTARYQVQIGQARLLGECYNYKLLPWRVVIDTLHLMLAVGHTDGDPQRAVAIDPPSSYFRIRLVSTVLETCGQYFGKGVVAARLDTFLLYLCRYLLSKPEPPLDVTLDLLELLENLRPGFQLPESYHDAATAVTVHEEQQQQQAAKSRASERSSGGLAAISEGGGSSNSGNDDSDGGSEGIGGAEGRRRAPQHPVASHSSDHDSDRDSYSGEEIEDGSGDGDDEEVRRLRESPFDEDPDFEAAFAEMAGPPVAHSHQQLPVSMMMRGQQQQQPGEPQPLDGTDTARETDTMGFRVMVKRGGRQERSKEVQLPLSHAMAAAVRRRDAEATLERATINRLTLKASSAQFAEADAEDRLRQWNRRQASKGPVRPEPATRHPPLQQQPEAVSPALAAERLPPRGHTNNRRGGWGRERASVSRDP